MKLLPFALVFALISTASVAQKGNYFLSHYTPPDERIDYRSMDMVQDEQGEIYFANKNGVLEFDGKNWKIISVPGAVYSLATVGTEVFVAGLAGAGYLSDKKQNPRLYQSISADPGFFSVVINGGDVFFCNDQQIIVYSIASRKISATIKTTVVQGAFEGLFALPDGVYLRADLGLFKVEGQKLTEVSTIASNFIFTSSSPSKKEYLVGTDNSKIFLHDGKSMREVVLKDKEYLDHNVLVDGVWTSDNLIALATLRGGVIFVNPGTGATEEIINYYSGLPDNEVYTLLTDRNQGVWAAHEYGFTRIAPTLPFRSFNHYSGLAGNLLCAQTFQGKMYVGTTLGLFLLTPQEIYEEISPAEVLNKQQAEKSKRRPGLNIFRRKKKAEVTALVAKTKILKSIGFAYKKVEGIDGKVTQLANINGKLVASGVSGVHEVDVLKSKVIIQEPVRSVFLSPTLEQLFVGTYDESIRTFAPTSKGWQETNLLDTLSDYISHSFEDKLQNIWLCGRNNIYKIETVDGDITDIVTIPIQNPSLDETVGLSFGSDVYIVASSQFKKYNGKNFVKFDSLPGARKYFATAGYFWFNDGTRWRTVDSRVKSLKLEWLGLFPSLRFLAPDSKGDGLWVITADNELYKFTNSVAESSDNRYPLFLREIRGQEIKLFQDVEVEQSENALTFEFIQPNYVGLQATQYRYQVKGLNNSWSTWSNTNNVIPFSYLPAGSYQLSVQSRDLLGNESKIEQVSFQVLPPYWKRWWFYALEFTVFSVLVVLSLRLAKSNTKYRYVSQLLSLLTVVMLIQFLQTAVGSMIGVKSSPVIEFIIQVFIALLVFPVEVFARDAMDKAAQGKYQIPKVWKKDTQG